MKRKIAIILSIIIILLSIFGLYQTFATNSSIVEQTDNTYDITLTDSISSVLMPAKSAKVIYYQVTNTNKGKVQYAVGYSSDNKNVYAKQYYDSTDDISGLIDYGEVKFIKLLLTNNSNSDTSITLSTILGYEHGGDLIVPEDVTLVSNNKNYLGTIIKNNLTKTQVKSITFENNNIIPSGDNIISYSVSSNSDNSIMLWYETNEENLYDVHIGSDNGVTSIISCRGLFDGYTALKTIDFDYFDTSDASDMFYMFVNCKSLTSLDLSNFDTSSVKNMVRMFWYCSSLTSLDLSSFDTSNVTNMTHMFYGCSSLTSLDLSKFNTYNVTDMSGMFLGCSSLTSLDLSGFDVTNVKYMGNKLNEGMFQGCSSLTSLDLSSFRTSAVIELYRMFDSCSSLKVINLSNFNCPNLTSLSIFIRRVNNLEELYLNSFDFSNVDHIGSDSFNFSSTVKIYVKDNMQQELFISKTNDRFTIDNVIIDPIVATS